MIDISTFPIWLWVLVGIAYIAGVSFIITGLFALAKNPKSWINRSFLIYTIVKGLWVFFAGTILWYPNLEFAKILYQWWWITLFLFTFYFFAFGINIMPFVRSSWRPFILLVCTILGFGVGFAWNALLPYTVEPSSLGWIWLPDLSLFFIGVAAFIVSYVVGLWGLLLAELETQSEEAKKTRRAIFYALLAHLLAAGLFVLLGRLLEAYWLVMFAPIVNMLLLPIAARRLWVFRSEPSRQAA